MSAAALAAEPENVSIELLESGDIDPAAFNHDAHVYVGWCYLRRHPMIEAVARFRTALIRLTEKLGVPDKYHETITWFFLILIAERMLGDSVDDWQTFRQRNADLFGSGMAILARHYSRERLMSPQARRQFLLPDRSSAAEIV